MPHTLRCRPCTCCPCACAIMPVIVCPNCLPLPLSEALHQLLHGGCCTLQGKGTKRKLKPHEVEGSGVVHKWRKERLK